MVSENFEDPAQRTSHVTAEGGYLWNHGGPYDAREQLFEMFGDIVSGKLIEEAAEEVEAEGISEWAPTHDDDEDNELLADAPSLSDFGDQPTAQYGSARDLEARERARAVLQDLIAMLDAPAPVGIGHNNPPEEIGEPDTIEVLRDDMVALHAEFGKPNPSISFVKKLGSTLRNAAIASIQWTARKIDLVIDTAIKTGVPAAGLALGAQHSEQLHKALDAVSAWLEIVASKF